MGGHTPEWVRLRWCIPYTVYAWAWARVGHGQLMGMGVRS